MPDKIVVAASLVLDVDRMFSPGAKRSMHAPMFDVTARVSLVGLVLPTVIAAGSAAGDWLHALAPLPFPADTTTVTFAATRATTSAFSVAETGPPMLILATAGGVALAVTNCTPARTLAVVGVQVPGSPTRTLWMATAFATPKVAAPMVPATCVP